MFSDLNSEIKDNKLKYVVDYLQWMEVDYFYK